MNLRIAAAIFWKDSLSLLPLVSLTALLFLGDAVITRLDWLPIWTEYGPAVLMVAMLVLVLTVFQLDSPASLTDDWLCRPIRIRELLAAKFALLACAIYLPAAVGAFAADMSLGYAAHEAFQDAVLLRGGLLPFLWPIFLFAAVITRNFVQGFAVLFIVFICVFVLPTPFVRPPGPLDPGIREGLWDSGVAWLATLPARLVCAVLLAAGLWLVYRRRKLLQARALLAFMVLATSLVLVAPMGLIPWESVFAMQRATGPGPRADDASIWLRHPHPCFPAALRSELSDPAFESARRRSGLRLWDEESLREVSGDSVAFLTRIEPRGLPLDWRVKLKYVRANYSAGGKTLYSLRPAAYLTDRDGGGSLAHAWMLPEPAVRDLERRQPDLELTYSLTLLQPREYALSVDGARRKLPGLGFCSAKPSATGAQIDVDCFSGFSGAAQISAELEDIPSTRVFGPVDFSPAWLRWPYASRTRLAIASPKLSTRGSITVTAWRMAGYLEESITLPGILGADAARCPLPSRGGTVAMKARWSDTAPHETLSLRVDRGVNLEVLDFGGTGSPILLLPGLGATAHSFDDIAPELATSHRVIALTRRGTGASSRPDFGFDTPRLARDVLAVMDQMELQKALLVGHSIAGEELTWLGAHHGDRFSGLVYLDAGFDRVADRGSARHQRLRELNSRRPPEPPLPPDAFVDYQAMILELERRGHHRYPEGELIAFLNVDQPDLAGTPAIDVRAQQAIMAALKSPGYQRIRIPALALYAFEDANARLPPWIDGEDTRLVSELAEARRLAEAMKRENMAVFRRDVAQGKALEIQNASHYIVLSNPKEVVRAITDFSAYIDAAN